MSTVTERRAPARFTLDGAAAAASCTGDAHSTAVSPPPRPSSIITAGTSTRDPMLDVPRPQTRGDCLQEARPCPWVGCSMHLLLEVERSEDNAPMLVLNRPSPTGQRGRRRGLASSAGEALVQVWLDDAIDRLLTMPYTCALDVIDELGALSDAEQADLLGCTQQAMSPRVARYKVRLRLGLEDRGINEEQLGAL